MRILSIVVGVVFFVLGQISFFLATYELMELQHEVNARLPLGEKLEPIFWSILARGKLRALQSVLPNSPKKGEALYDGWCRLLCSCDLCIVCNAPPLVSCVILP